MLRRNRNSLNWSRPMSNNIRYLWISLRFIRTVTGLREDTRSCVQARHINVRKRSRLFLPIFSTMACRRCTMITVAGTNKRIPSQLNTHANRKLINNIQQTMNYVIGCSSISGRKNKNEDRYSHLEIIPGIEYLAVADGHCGDFAADFVAKTLPELIHEQLMKEDLQVLNGQFVSEKVEEILPIVFNKCQESLAIEIDRMAVPSRDRIGTTALIALLVDNSYIIISHVGDGKAILCREGKPYCLTDEHSPTNELEAERILSMGGWIDWDTKFYPLVNGRLTMTRSFGDLPLKQFGVTSVPYTDGFEIDGQLDMFFVLCTDGVTQTISDNEIIHIVGQYECPTDAANALTSYAQQYGSNDDATAIVVALKGWGKKEYLESESLNFSFFRTMIGTRKDG